MLDLTKRLAEARVVPVLQEDTGEQATAAGTITCVEAGVVAVGIDSALAGRSDLADLAHRFLDPNPTGEAR